MAAFGAGAWCTANFWRCHHAHRMVSGAGWLVLSVGLRRGGPLVTAMIAGEEQPVFLSVLAVGLGFEVAWYLTRGTNAVTFGSRQTG